MLFPGGSGHNKCTENQAGVWMPMNREAKKDWSWVDWMRFLFYRQASNPDLCIWRDLNICDMPEQALSCCGPIL